MSHVMITTALSRTESQFLGNKKQDSLEPFQILLRMMRYFNHLWQPQNRNVNFSEEMITCVSGYSKR